jgi:predicted ribosome quality control (RQC) complex YloA/Tae2 family protein
MVLLAAVIKNDSQISDALTKMLMTKTDDEREQLNCALADKEGFKLLATQSSDMLVKEQEKIQTLRNEIAELKADNKELRAELKAEREKVDKVTAHLLKLTKAGSGNTTNVSLSSVKQ